MRINPDLNRLAVAEEERHAVKGVSGVSGAAALARAFGRRPFEDSHRGRSQPEAAGHRGNNS